MILHNIIRQYTYAVVDWEMSVIILLDQLTHTFDNLSYYVFYSLIV